MIFFSLALRTHLLIILSFLGGMVFMFLPLPYTISWLNSFWLVLLLLYWCLMLPQYINVGIAWFVGIFLDMVYGVPVGAHALALVLIAFIFIKMRQKILPLGFLKTAPFIFGLILLYQLLLVLLQVYLGNKVDLWLVGLGAFLAAILWPPLALILFNLQLKFRI